MPRTINVTIRGITPLSQSKYLAVELAPGESHNDHDKRRWAEKMHTNADGRVVIPAMAILQAVQVAAGADDEKVSGRGNRKWGTLFKGGVAIYDDVVTDVDASTVQPQTFLVDAQGKKGDASSSRVPRTFPMIAPGWTASFQLEILDDSIPIDRDKHALATAGARVGVGRFRPAKGGINGRFAVVSVTEDATESAA